ncbi:hypothetical protein [Halobacillus ihumii]|nr:hypothetical protein [Halobacillus ihumii]
MDFASLHKEKRQLDYAKAWVQLRPNNENTKELQKFKKEIKQNRRKTIAV